MKISARPRDIQWNGELQRQMERALRSRSIAIADEQG